MLEHDFKTRWSLNDISQDEWVTEKEEIDKLKELKRRNYQLKKVYAHTKI